MIARESIPFAPNLIESMRSLGYSFETAIADLIDNSISANASKIDILLSPIDNPYLIILDNGYGMNSKELEEALRYGAKNPLERRENNDLGRFGLGMKSASLSRKGSGLPDPRRKKRRRSLLAVNRLHPRDIFLCAFKL